MNSITFTAMVGLWIVFAWAFLMMVISAFNKDPEFSFGLLFGGTFLLKEYNRVYFRVLLGAFVLLLAMVAAVILLDRT
ncbi:hypothetical protein [Bradyrhizobium sp.]|uniref:hypothetical protein n=1 Tax=Bradyrhizobium sp. TaxID=376 RepID=UPI004037BA29